MHGMAIVTCPGAPSPLPLLYGAPQLVIGCHIYYVGVPECGCVC